MPVLQRRPVLLVPVPPPPRWPASTQASFVDIAYGREVSRSDPLRWDTSARLFPTSTRPFSFSLDLTLSSSGTTACTVSRNGSRRGVHRSRQVRRALSIHLATLEVIPDDIATSSTFGGDRESIASSTTSLQSAVTKYTFEHGRRYHAYNAGSYNFPNDDEESDRMDLEHVNQKIQIDGRLHLCPLPKHPTEILDLGTGTGIWAVDMGA